MVPVPGYLSGGDSAWRVISGALPVTVDYRTAHEALNAARKAFPSLEISPYIWAKDKNFSPLFLRPLTRDDALTLRHGQNVYCLGVVGTRIFRCRVSGACKTWKTRPGEFSLPVKYGLRDSYRISHIPFEWSEWYVAAPEVTL
jgi:hypothetical protein